MRAWSAALPQMEFGTALDEFRSLCLMEKIMSTQSQGPAQNRGTPDANASEEEKKRIELERVQKEAAEEREETPGYQ